MAFKNAFKIFISKFSLVWVVGIYLLIIGLIVSALSFPFITAMVNAVKNAGIDVRISQAFQNLLDGVAISEVTGQIGEIVKDFEELFKEDKAFSFGSLLSLFLIVTLVSRFLFGFYELPLLKVLEGSMSSNAKLGFFGAYISKIAASAKFVLVKMVYTILFDIVIYGVTISLLGLFKISVLSFFAPFIIMSVVIVLLALRYTFVSMWSPSLALGEQKLFGGLLFSLKRSVKHFRSVFSTFIITWILIIALNIFIGIFTLLAGLVATIPMSILFVSIVNMTVYYNKNNKRYYVDEVVYNPPTVR